MIGFKGFDYNFRCRGFQYEVGETYTMQEDPVLCSKGFHFCTFLQDVFSYYGRNTYGSRPNKFAVVESLGKTLTDGHKSATNSIKIIKLLSIDEIDGILKEEEANFRDERVYMLRAIRHLQSKYNFCIGGSSGLYLHGYDLGRQNGEIDFDIVMPYYQVFEQDEMIKHVEMFDDKGSGNDFSETALVELDNGKTLKFDLVVDPKQKWQKIDYKGNSYKVTDIFTILAAKMKYAQQRGGEKHRNDILKMIEKPKEKKKSVQEQIDEI